MTGEQTRPYRADVAVPRRAASGRRRPTDPRYRLTAAGEILEFFRSRSKHVITFAGFGELGYQEEGVVERIAADMLATSRRRAPLVNSGTLLRRDGEDGIAAVYEVARAAGIETAGIHPGIALDFADTHTVSPHEDHPFFVADRTWGGLLDDGRPSPTLELLLAVSDELVVIGGGKHAGDELGAFLARGKPTRYFPAEMNHRATRAWCREAGLDRPLDLRGAAHRIWQGRHRRPA